MKYIEHTKLPRNFAVYCSTSKQAEVLTGLQSKLCGGSRSRDANNSYRISLDYITDKYGTAYGRPTCYKIVDGLPSNYYEVNAIYQTFEEFMKDYKPELELSYEIY